MNNSLDLNSWEQGIGPEISFWAMWFATKGLQWPNDYKNRLDPDLPLSKDIIELLDTPAGGVARILDVGAGPLTLLGKKWSDRSIRITAVDPLADRYNKIIEAFGITPLVLTQRGEVEKLEDLFLENEFDLVHIQNALDHSYDPVLGIDQMIRVVKRSGHVVLKHEVNEAENENYHGFHQWNFCQESEDFIIWNKHSRVNVSEKFSNIAEIKCVSNSTHIIVDIVKKINMTI